MKHDKPAKGLWFAPCCIEDVQQVESDEDAADIIESLEDGPWISFGYYDTREELVAAIEEVDGPPTGDSNG